MGISENEFKRRYVNIRKIMEEKGLDSLLVIGYADHFNRGNIRYITGSGGGGTCIFPLEGDPVFLGGPRSSTNPKLKRTMHAHDLLRIVEATNPVDQVIKELSGFDKGNKIGLVGMNCITVPLYLALKEKYNDRIVETANILEPLRDIKSEEEFGKIRVAASIADEVYARLRKAVKPGVSECKIYSVVKQAIHEMGCEYSMDFIDAAGSTMNLTGYPTMDELEAGGTLFMEVTPSYEGYYGQLPLTLPVTEYSSTVRPMVSAWNKADKELRKILRPGTQVSDIAKTLVNTVQENGFISPMRPGHSVGLDALDFWSVTEDSTKVLQPGMALALHASVMSELGGDACGMGYTYFITDTGYEKPSKIDLAQELIGE